MARPRKPPRMVRRENGTWEVIYFDPKVNRTVHRSLGTEDEGKAREAFSRWLVRYSPDDVQEDQLTVSDVLLFYEAHAHKTFASPKKISSSIKQLMPFFGNKPAKDVGAKLVKEYTKARSETVMPSTIRSELTCLRSAFSHAAKEGFGGLNFVPVFAKPPISDPKEDYLTPEQISTLLSYLERNRRDGEIGDIEAFVVLAFRTAARRTAALEVTWDRVYWDRNQIDFRTPEWLALPRARRIKRRTIVPMSEKLRSFMLTLWEQRGKPTSGPVFTTISDSSIGHALIRLSGKVGFTVTAHLLRRSFGSIASMQGISTTEISRIMGNTEQIAEQRYIRFNPNYLQSAVEID
jgi:integrase